MSSRRTALAAALLLVPVSAANARALNPVTPTPVGPLQKIASVDDAACTYELLTTACQWAFELDPSASGDPSRHWYGMVGAVSVTPPPRQCLIAVRVISQYPLEPGTPSSLIVRTQPATSQLHADPGGWTTLLLNVDAGGAATPPGTLSETVRGARGAISKWIAITPERGPGGMPTGSRVLNVITEWSGRSAGTLQLATAEEEVSASGLILGGVSVVPQYQPGACTYVAPAGPGFYVAPALPVSKRTQTNCILVRAPDPARVTWSVSGPAYRSTEQTTAIHPIAGYGRACLPIGTLEPGRYLAHVQLHGGRAARRYDVAFKITP